MKRLGFLSLGYLMVALGFVGIFLPVLPTTPFLILAAACFTRSSPRLEAWLLGHPRFGSMLRDWRARGAIPRGTKMLSLGSMVAGYLLFWFGSRPGLPVSASVAVLMLAGALYVATRPE